MGSWSLSAAELEAEQDPRARASSYEQRRAWVERRVERAVLAENARAAGYEDHPEVRAAAERALVAQFLGDELEQRLAAVEITAEDVEARYRADQARYTTPERVRTAAILIPVHPRATEAARAAKREKIEAALAAAAAEIAAGTAGRTFGALAVRYSEDQVTRYRGGDLGWVDRREAGSAKPAWNPQLAEAALALAEPGTLTPVIETKAGFAIAKILERRPEQTQPLADVADAIRSRLLRDARQAVRDAFMAEMHARVDVEIDEEQLRALGSETAPEPNNEAPRPPAMPVGLGG